MGEFNKKNLNRFVFKLFNKNNYTLHQNCFCPASRVWIAQSGLLEKATIGYICSTTSIIPLTGNAFSTNFSYLKDHHELEYAIKLNQHAENMQNYGNV
jgi:hypothetical protein